MEFSSRTWQLIENMLPTLLSDQHYDLLTAQAMLNSLVIEGVEDQEEEQGVVNVLGTIIAHLQRVERTILAAKA